LIRLGENRPREHCDENREHKKTHMTLNHLIPFFRSAKNILELPCSKNHPCSLTIFCLVVNNYTRYMPSYDLRKVKPDLLIVI
jgi:hypothetical protein